MGNQFYDLGKVDCAWSRLKKMKISLMCISRDFFFDIAITELWVIRIDSSRPYSLYYFMLRMDWMRERAWLVMGRLGIALNKIGKLCNPFSMEYWSRFWMERPLPKLMVGS